MNQPRWYQFIEDVPEEAKTEFDGKWTKNAYQVAEVFEYDVKQTDSTVAPYEAFIVIRAASYSSGFHDTQVEAGNSKLRAPREPTDDDKFRFEYNYQDGKWVLYGARREPSSGVGFPIGEDPNYSLLVSAFSFE